MSGLYFLLPTLLVILISFLVVRAASIALMMTGLDQKRARFQALSAFSGTGFTTKEAESVVSHPKRRIIVTWLMILGNAGIVTVVVTATSSLVTSRGYNVPINILILIAGIYVIYRVVTHKGFVRSWESFIEDKFMKSRVFEEEVTEDLLHLAEGYGLIRVLIKEDAPAVGVSLDDGILKEKSILVLGIEREKAWLPVPKGKEIINNGDKLVVYGPLDTVKSFFRV